mmetsp:Transcript_10821/g.19265  ORF Transcript_10821/g.19265 Transcript_10821/m.19265 type:complete len:239 (+) Transcript_10821:892-1608(+)
MIHTAFLFAENSRLMCVNGLNTIPESLTVGLGIAEKHQIVILEHQRIVHTSITSSHGALHHDTLLSFPNMQHGHPSQSGIGVIEGTGVDDVVCPQNHGNICILEIFVDLLHLENDFVVDPSLSKQHIQLPRHTASHRVDPEAHFHTLLNQSLGHFSQRVLSLCHGQTIARHNDDTGGLSKHLGHLTNTGLLDNTSHLLSWSFGGSKTSKEHISDATVHGNTHDICQDGTRGTYKGANN